LEDIRGELNINIFDLLHPWSAEARKLSVSEVSSTNVYSARVRQLESAAIAYNRHLYLCYDLSATSCDSHPHFGSGPRPPIRLARPNRMVFSTHKFATAGQYNIARYFVVNVRESYLPASKTSLEDCLKLSRIQIRLVHAER
jgi:hypothetical protein